MFVIRMALMMVQIYHTYIQINREFLWKDKGSVQVWNAQF